MNRKDKIEFIIKRLDQLNQTELDHIARIIQDRGKTPREGELREQLTQVSHLLYQKDYNTSLDGNVSIRLNDEEILISPSRIHKGFIQPYDFIVIDYEGKLMRGKGKPTSETPLHLAVYDARKDVNAVIHAHCPNAIAVSIAGLDLTRMYLTQPPIPTTDFAMPSSEEGATEIRKYASDYDWVILRRHGAVTFGKDIWEAFLRVEELEQIAKIVLVSASVGELTPIDKPHRDKLKTLFNSMKEIKSGD
jgi:L-fuculose-phosphate aldolase